MKTKGIAILLAVVFVGFCGIVAYNASSDDSGVWHVNFEDNPAPGDTVTVDGVQFTFVDGPSEGLNVSIGGTVTESRNNLASAIERNTDFEVS